MIALKNFIIAGSLCLAITGVTIVHAGGPPAVGPIPFEYFDRDNSGFVTEEEFYLTRGERLAQRSASGRLMRHAGDAPAFEYFDKDNDGKMTHKEFMRGHLMRMQRQFGMSSYTNELAFYDIDLDGSGTISNSEFAQARSRVMSNPQHRAPYQGNMAKLPDFIDIDVNENGVIDPGEFRSHQLQH